MRSRTLALVLLVASAASITGAELLPPPIPGPLVPASSFGEYRSGHYHGGLDFSTGGREGLPVLAPRAGWVYRVRASGVGYGRSVYLRLHDGRTLVFAHLSRFEPALAAYVDAAQDRMGRYEVDLYPEPETIEYDTGDTLAYTGQSGAGPPHLHAEVRTGEEASLAQNPWTHGWTPPDSIAPRINRLRVLPAAPGVLVQGALEPIVVSLGQGTSPEVRVTGRVRFWVETWDPVHTGARMAPYRLTARVDEDVVAEVVFDEVDWNWAREVNWTYHAGLAREGQNLWIALDPAPGGRQQVARAEKNWLIDLDPGSYRLTLLAADAAGNTSRATVRLVKEAPNQTALGTVRAPSMKSRGDYVEVRLPGASPALLVRDDTGRSGDVETTRLSIKGGTVFQFGKPDHPGVWNFVAGDSLLGRALWLPGAVSAWPWKRDSLMVEISGQRVGAMPEASYGPLWVLLRSTPSSAAPELEPLTRAVTLEPGATPLREDMSIECAVPGARDRKGMALMRREDTGWTFVGADTSGTGLRGRIGALETVAVFRDRTPPRIRISPVTGRRPRVRATVEDKGVGVALSSLRCMLDGKDVIAEWDPDAGVVIGHPRQALGPGPHDVVFVAADRVGNTSRARLAFTVR